MSRVARWNAPNRDRRVIEILRIGRRLTQMNTDTAGTKLRLGALTKIVIGAFYDVYNELGYGFLESVYQRAMEIALAEAGLQVRREVPIEVRFRNRRVGFFKVDLLVENVLAVELKSASALNAAHEAQILNLLRATKLEVGLLCNFGPRPRFRRFVFDNEHYGRIRVHPR